MASWIETIVQTTGVFGIALLMFLENVFPPIPSELIMPLAGYTAAKGEANIVLVILAGTPARSPARSSGTGSAGCSTTSA